VGLCIQAKVHRLQNGWLFESAKISQVSTDPTPSKVDHLSIGMLGVLTICAYGSWYYAFGVLLDPIRIDTGWRESSLALSFSLGTVGVGVGSPIGGRLLDHYGHQKVFLVAGLVGAGGLIVASTASSTLVFAGGAAVGLGAFGSMGFYHITMSLAVRLHPDNSSRAIAVLTLWGAIASTIFIPLASWLVTAHGWRVTTRILAVVTWAAFWLAVVVVRPAPGAPHRRAQPSVGRVLYAIIGSPASRWFSLAVALGGIAMATLLAYQVPVMTAAGLPAGVAASMAGLRGLFQLTGRIPIGYLVARLGTNGSLMLAFGAMGTSGLLLRSSSSIAVAVAFAVVAGFGVGSFSPLQGMKASELFDHESLGMTMGLYGGIMLVAGGIGPAVGGVIVDWTGDRSWVPLIVVVAGVLSVLCVGGMAHVGPKDAES